MSSFMISGASFTPSMQLALQGLTVTKAAQRHTIIISDGDPSPPSGALIQSYTREAGVRNLEREIGALARKTARRIAEDGISGPVSVWSASFSMSIRVRRRPWFSPRLRHIRDNIAISENKNHI